MKVNRYIKNTEAYSSPGWPDKIEEVIRLGMNEGDFIAPEVLDAIKNLCIETVARHYPPGEMPELVDLIKKTHNVGKNTDILLYPGSDNAIDNIIRTFSEPGDTIIMRYPEYGNTVLFAQTHGLNIVYVKPQPINNLTVESLIDAYEKHRPAIIYFSNPHNPTGQFIPPHELEKLAKSTKDSILIIDEAYIHFADLSFEGTLPLVEKYENVIITRTFSKLFGLAGLRIGFAAVNRNISHYLRILQRTKDITYLAQYAALQSLIHIEKYREAARAIMYSREYVASSLRDMGIEVMYPSYGNFILFKPPIEPPTLYERLAGRGFITRFYDTPEMKDYMRVSIWRQETMEKFISTLREVL